MNRQIAREMLDVLCLRDAGCDVPLNSHHASQRASQRDATTPASAAPTAAVAWNDEDVRDLLTLVEYEGAHIWLYRRIQQRGVTVPDQFRAALKEMSNRASVVNMRIDEQTAHAASILNTAGIPWSLLKGQARRAAATRYPFANARRVSDVDLLVPAARADDAWQLLCTHGFRRVYEETPLDFKGGHHLPALIDASNVAVEMHTTTSTVVPAAEAWRRATEGSDPVHWNGLDTHVPNPTELVWQALAAGVADGYRGFVLKSFLNVAAVLAVQPDINWDVIRQRMDAREVMDNETENRVEPARLREYLGIAARLGGVGLPAAVAPRRDVDLVPFLLWRSRVLASGYGRAAKERLLEEAGRIEAGLPITPLVERAGLLRGIRRRLSSIAARGAYRGWRYLA